MTPLDPWIRTAALALCVGLLGLRLSRPALAELPWSLRAIASGPTVSALCGILLGFSVPDWVGAPMRQLVQPALVFLAGWVGLSAGCGLDLRVAGRTVPIAYMHELGAALGAAAIVLLLAYAAPRAVATAPGLAVPALLVLAAVCVSGPALPLAHPGPTRWAGRGGTWSPSAAAVLATLLAAAGLGLAPTAPFHLSVPGFATARLLLLDGAITRILWGAAGGCMAGLLADLATKDDFAPGGLYPPIVAVVLVAAGAAGAIGLEPLLVGAVAGFWLINATLRRLDILRVLERAAALPRLAAPFAAGWLVGAGTRQAPFEPATFLFALIVVTAVRPAVRLGCAHLIQGVMRRSRRRRPEPLTPDLIELDELGILAGAVLTRVLPAAAAGPALAGVLAGQLLLTAAARWWERRDVLRAGPAG